MAVLYQCQCIHMYTYISQVCMAYSAGKQQVLLTCVLQE